MSTETYILLKSKKRKGLDLFYERYAKALFRYATQNWKTDEDLAWELIYQTLDSIIEKIDQYQFESEAKFSSFVLTVFLNRIRNQYRQAKNHPSTISLEENSTELLQEVDEEIPESLLMGKLNLALQNLEDWERMLLLLRAQQMPYAEIARYIDKPENQLKVYYQRLKIKLEKDINLIQGGQHEN